LCHSERSGKRQQSVLCSAKDEESLTAGEKIVSEVEKYFASCNAYRRAFRIAKNALLAVPQKPRCCRLLQAQNRVVLKLNNAVFMADFPQILVSAS